MADPHSPQSTQRQPAASEHRREQNGEEQPTSSEFGETLLFVVMAGILVVLTIVLNAAVRQTVLFVRETFAL